MCARGVRLKSKFLSLYCCLLVGKQTASSAGKQNTKTSCVPIVKRSCSSISVADKLLFYYFYSKLHTHKHTHSHTEHSTDAVFNRAEYVIQFFILPMPAQVLTTSAVAIGCRCYNSSRSYNTWNARNNEHAVVEPNDWTGEAKEQGHRRDNVVNVAFE